MDYLIYLSRASQPMDGDGNASLLSQCAERNQQDDLTGLLIYKGPFAGDDCGYYLQYIEGPPAPLAATAARIKADSRHTDFLMLKEGQIDTRRFPNWSMGFRHVDESEFADADGFADLRSAQFWRDAQSGKAEKVVDVIQFFYLEDV